MKSFSPGFMPPNREFYRISLPISKLFLVFQKILWLTLMCLFFTRNVGKDWFFCFFFLILKLIFPPLNKGEIETNKKMDQPQMIEMFMGWTLFKKRYYGVSQSLPKKNEYILSYLTRYLIISIYRRSFSKTIKNAFHLSVHIS